MGIAIHGRCVWTKKNPVFKPGLKGSKKRGFQEDPRRQLEINELIDMRILG